MPIATGRARLGALAALLLLPGLAAAGDVTFQARVDQTEISQDEVVTLEIRLESPEPPSGWDVPPMPDFDLVAEMPSQSQSISMGGGGGVLIRTQFALVRQLHPKHAGSLTIPSIAVVVRKHRYVTQPIVVKVTAARAAPKGPGAGGPPPGAQRPGAPRGGWAYHGWERDVALRAEVERREVWMGEQLPVTFWLVSPYQVVHYGNGKPPRYEGFWQEVLETPAKLEAVQRGDALAYLVQRVALFPTRAGELTIDPFGLHEVTVPVRGGGFDPFGDVVQLDRSTEPVPIKVKPLPPNPPPGFEPSNVGSLTLDVKTTPERVAVGEPITVRVTVSGDGNVRALTPPRLPEIPGARVFQPTSSDRAEARKGRLQGSRTVETVLVPDRAGELVIPGISWPFFDPRAGKYQVAMAPAQRVTVLPAAPAAAPRGPGAGSAALAGLHGIRADAALRRAGPPPWQTPWFLALLALPPLAFAAAAGLERLRAADAGLASRVAGRSARRTLATARRRLSRDPAGAMGEVERALLIYASGRLGRPAAGLTREALTSALTRAGAHPPAVRMLLQALELVDASRYGAGDAHGEEVLSAAEDALSALDEADWQPDREVGA